MALSGHLHTLRKNPEYPLNWRLSGLQNQMEHFGEEKNLSLLGFVL
jgi:hypothetical protein